MSNNFEIDVEMTDEQFAEAARAFAKRAADQREQETKARQRYQHRQILGLEGDEWGGAGTAEFEKETERMTAQFTAAKAKQDAQDQEQLLQENAVAWMNSAGAARYIANPANGANLEAYIKQHNLPPTPAAIQRAYDALAEKGLLDLKPATIKPPRVYTVEEMYEMPEEQLIELSREDAARLERLNRGRR